MPDIPRIYTAIAEWMACMLFILPVKKRFDNAKTGALMAVFLIVQSVFLMITGSVKIYFWIPCMIIAVLLMIGFIYGCCEISLRDAGYFGMIAFVAAEFMASMIPSNVKSIMDIGCGDKKLKKYLNQDIKYYGLDFVSRGGDN